MKFQNSLNKINILLPFKEKFSSKNFGSVSLYVKDINQNSKFNNEITIYANKVEEFFSGFKVCKLNKSIWHLILGKNKAHTLSFINSVKKDPPKIIEVHNRPQSANLIANRLVNSKIFLFYHNDPLSFNSNNSIKQRLELLDNCEMIFFVSFFLKERFILDLSLSKSQLKKLQILYNGIHISNQIQISSKKKNIVFIGELNQKKGFDFFLQAALLIIQEFPDWSVDIFGKTNSLSKHLINKNKKIRFHGYKNNSFILKFLKYTSISVIPSVWDEPFGRVLLESINAGTATITSTNGGLKEIARHFKVLKLKEINKKTIYLSIKKLIMSQNEKRYYSNNSVKNSPFTLKKITSNLDLLRKATFS